MKKQLPHQETTLVSSPRRVTAKPEWQILQEWVADVMTHYARVGDPILKLGYSTVKQMVKERLQKVCITEDNKRRFLVEKGVVKDYSGASPRASIPNKKAKPKPRQIIGRIDIKDIL